MSSRQKRRRNDNLGAQTRDDIIASVFGETSNEGSMVVPKFAMICRDKPDAGDLRRETRERHLTYLEAMPGAVWLAGPMLSDAGAPVGSIIIIEAADQAAAETLAANDPYAKAGLFESVEVTPYRFVTGKLLSQ